ncbi:MAG: hypothetical protein V1778_02740 [bacterium]
MERHLVADMSVDAGHVLVAVPSRDRPWGLPGFIGFTPITVPFLESAVWFATKPGVLHAHEAPHPSFSSGRGSEAIYIGRSANKDDGWLVQVVPPHGRTSRHHHKRKRERFIPLFGTCRVGLAEGYQKLSPGLDLEVAPPTTHHLRTDEHAALNLLIIQWIDGEAPEGVDPLAMEDHNYEPYPLWF